MNLNRMARTVYTVPLVLALCAADGCARRVGAPVVTSPRYPDFMFPAVPSGLGDPVVLSDHDVAWRYLQIGDLRSAERGFAALVKRLPSFYPADAGLGFVDLARSDPAAAVAHFDRALAKADGYIPALVGRGDALLAAGRLSEATASLEAAVARDPTLAGIGQRIEVLRFRIQQEALASARRAAESGDLDGARRQFARAIEESPDSAFLYRELAAVEAQAGDRDAALDHLRKASALDPADTRVLVQMGEVHEARGEYDAAVAAYGKAAALEPGEAIAKRLESARERAALGRLPAEYRALREAAELTRGDVAAIIGIRLPTILTRAPQLATVVLTDTRGHWAAPWILAVTQAGVMDEYPNHTFRPRAPVRRGDLAEAVSRLLGILGSARPGMSARWRAAQPAIADLPPSHLRYGAAAVAVASGVMPLIEGRLFMPGRPVGGEEAFEVITRIEGLAR